MTTEEFWEFKKEFVGLFNKGKDADALALIENHLEDLDAQACMMIITCINVTERDKLSEALVKKLESFQDFYDFRTFFRLTALTKLELEDTNESNCMDK